MTSPPLAPRTPARDGLLTPASDGSSPRRARRCALPDRQRALHLARFGAGVGLSACALAAVGTATSSTLLVAPFAASAALKHAAPHGPLARPSNVIGGYVLGALVGVAIGMVLGSGLVAVAVATSVAAVLMMALHVEHPPAVAMTFVALHTPGLWPIEVAIAGSVTLVATMFLLAPTLHGRPLAPADC